MEKDPSYTPPPPLSPEELIARMEIEQERLQQIKSDLARVALHDSSQAEEVVKAADVLVRSANEVHEVAIGREAVHDGAFGNEESYWTVYRMFASVNNIGRLWELDEIWQYLAKNYDMSKETYESLETTLDEWRTDLEEDAASKGITGWFIQHEGKYTFAERQSDTVPAVKRRTTTKTRTSVSSPAERSEAVVKESHEVASPLQTLKSQITDILSSLPEGIARQADVKKQLATAANQEELDQLQATIDELVRREELYKFRRGKIAHLSLTPRADEAVQRMAERTPETDRIEEEDTLQLQLDILRALCGPGTQYQRKITLRELWRTIHEIEDKSESIPDSELDQLKQACRQLRTTGLITARGEKMGTAGVKTNTGVSSKRRRSGSMPVYKVGLTSQQVKKDLQKVLDTPQAADYLQEKFTQAP